MGNPLEAWTPGAYLPDFRQIQFGGYIFPLTFQEKDRNLKMMLDRRKLAMNFGEYIDGAANVGGRDVEIAGDVGSLVRGSAGGVLQTAADLELERTVLAGLQVLGKQPLWVRPDRYLHALMSEFDFKFMPDGGAFRYATWDVKFIADDPRYYSTQQNTFSMGPFTDTAQHTHAISHLGNVKAFPTIVITGACTHPTIWTQTSDGSKQVSVRFSKLTMIAGDTLTIQCDPRPEYRNNAVVYTPSGGIAQNGMKYINPASDFGNTWDARQFFPLIETNLYGGYAGQLFGVQSTVAGSYSVSVTFNDTWL
jgi:hypothetical protein